MASRATVIQAFLDLFENPNYLEIGVNRGETFHALQAGRKVAVDPHFLFSQEEREPSEEVTYVEVTSDEYFASREPGPKFDVIFIDGLHTFDQTLKDLLNSVLLLQEHGVMIVDDVIPSSYDASLRDFEQVAELRKQTKQLGVVWETDDSWMGDVYKIPFFVEQFMQQMSFATVAENHGQSVIWRQTRPSEALPEADFEGIARLDFRDTILRRPSYRLRPLHDIVADVIHAYKRPSPTLAGAVRPSPISLPVDSLVSTLESPGEQMPTPQVSFAELMPDPVKGVQARSWGAYRADKAIDGLVFDEHGAVYTATTAKFSDEEVLAGFHALKAALLGDSAPTRHQGSHLLCGQAGLSNYGHWLVEILPAAFLMRDAIINGECKVYVPKIYPWMASVVADSLELLQIGPSNCVYGNGAPVWFEELILVSGMTEHGKFYLPITADCLKALSAEIQPDGSEKVWVSRLGEARSLVCEAEVHDRLKSDGWRIMLPREMSLREQMAACKGAQSMAGVNGAGLTNMGFMPMGGHVTSFVPAHMPDLFFWALAANSKLAFHDVRSPMLQPENSAITWNGKLTLAADEVIRLIS
jgi:hypothetical protein